MQETFIQIIEQYGYIGIAFLIFAETVFPPIPSEAVLLFGGFMTVRAGLRLSWVVLAATAGAVLGAALLYLLGRWLGKERLERLAAGRPGKWLHIRPEQVGRADAWFQKRAYASVLVCRCVPVLRSLISLPAGLARMPFLPFLGLTAAGSYLWNTALCWAGRLAGDAWQKSLRYIRWSAELVTALFLLTAVVTVILLVIKQKGQRAG